MIPERHSWLTLAVVLALGFGPYVPMPETLAHPFLLVAATLLLCGGAVAFLLATVDLLMQRKPLTGVVLLTTCALLCFAGIAKVWGW